MAEELNEDATVRSRKKDDDYDELWHATLAGEFDPEPDLGYFPGEDE